MGGGMGGGMGGMGGGMGGMGGGMGGMGGGMGGMGGGMGGMGGGMGGMGGGMGGGGMGGGTMPASMGMMMLGRLIMSLVGDRDSWDQRSLMMGMMMGMGGGMMGGGMMGGMGGMGGGMGGMGGGFRSVPPTSLPETTLKPKQTRHLPTALVSLSGPQDDKGFLPEKGEPLRIGAIGQVTDDARVQAALKRLAEEKAPQTISQLVMWNVASRLDWDAIALKSKGWANAQELALARQFVARRDAADGATPKADSGVLYWEVTARDAKDDAVAARLRSLLGKFTVLGLKAQAGVPDKPAGPSLACRIALEGDRAEVKFTTTDADGTAWVALDPLTLKLPDDATEPGQDKDKDKDKDKAESKERIDPETRKAAKLADGLATGLLQRLVLAKLSKGPRIKGREGYLVRIANASPFILNGLALAGTDDASATPPSPLTGISLPPRKALTLPATAEMVERLHLKDGVRVIAADLSGL
jgi:hypothetical protein